MRQALILMIREEIARGRAKWGKVDTSPQILLNAALEELGEVAHAINHEEGAEVVKQEIAEVIGILARLYDMEVGLVWQKKRERQRGG